MTEAQLAKATASYRTALFLDEEMAKFSIIAPLLLIWCHLPNSGRHIPYWLQRYCCIVLDLFRHGYNAGFRCLNNFSLLSDCCFRLVLLHWKDNKSTLQQSAFLELSDVKCQLSTGFQSLSMFIPQGSSLCKTRATWSVTVLPVSCMSTTTQ